MSITGNIALLQDINQIYSGDNINLTIEIENLEKIFVKGKI